MITYVNTVLVSNLATGKLLITTPTIGDAGAFVIMNCDANVAKDKLYDSAGAKQIKIGLVTSEKTQIIAKDGTRTEVPVIKWSNIIKKEDIKSYVLTKHDDHADDPEKVVIDLGAVSGAPIESKLALGGKRIIVKITYKDMPHRFRKWTESYEYVTKVGDTAETIAKAIMNMINKDYKRARVTAALDGTKKVKLTAMEYDDDNSVDSISPANKVRFDVNVYYTDPTAAAFASRNKYFIDGVKIEKTDGVFNPLNSKLIRDREAQAMGYEGILNRGEGTWPIIKPAMQTVLENKYDGITLEFENMYRTADDLFRKTKQTVEIYAINQQLTALDTALKKFAGIA